MTFQFHALPMEPFDDLFALSNADLAPRKGRKVTADSSPGFPCRVSLQDAQIGEELVLLNYQHLDSASPYAASHAIYVRRGAKQAHPEPGEIPQVLSSRLLSVRSFDAHDLMQDADVVEGADLAAALDAIFANPAIRFVDVHNAKPGCFAARATRA